MQGRCRGDAGCLALERHGDRLPHTSLYLPCTSLYLPYTSPYLPLHLPTTRLQLAYISPTSPLHLPYISPNQAIAYLMYANGWGYERAYAFVRERRGIASPNAGFIARLGLGLGLGSG